MVPELLGGRRMANPWGISWGSSWGLAWAPQFAGLKIYDDGGVVDLCLVALADAPAGMGGVWEVEKNGIAYAVYLVETTDPNASSARIETTTGVKAARLKT